MRLVVAVVDGAALHRIDLFVQFGTGLIAFPDPLDQRVALPLFDLRGGRVIIFLRHLLVGKPLVIDQLAVPERVQIGAITVIVQLDRIAPLIFLAADMHRLVKIADKMDDKFQRFDLLGTGRSRAAKDALLLLQGTIYIVLGRAFYFYLEIGETKSEGQVDIMPRSGAPV